jgi:hypothetical protein
MRSDEPVARHGCWRCRLSVASGVNGAACPVGLSTVGVCRGVARRVAGSMSVWPGTLESPRGPGLLLSGFCVVRLERTPAPCYPTG